MHIQCYKYFTGFLYFLETKTKPNESTGIMGIKKNARSMENLLEYGVKEEPRDCSPAAEPNQKPGRQTSDLSTELLM